jgi:hypothetical protein
MHKYLFLSRAQKPIFFSLLIPASPHLRVPMSRSLCLPLAPSNSPSVNGFFQQRCWTEKISPALFRRRNHCALNALWRRTAAFARQSVQRRYWKSPDRQSQTPLSFMGYVPDSGQAEPADYRPLTSDLRPPTSALRPPTTTSLS